MCNENIDNTVWALKQNHINTQIHEEMQKSIIEKKKTHTFLSTCKERGRIAKPREQCARMQQCLLTKTKTK